MLDNELEKTETIWKLTKAISWGDDGIFKLLIRDDWVKLGGVILSLSRSPAEPFCVLLKGKSGRGKTVFMKYLVFRILLDAKEKCREHLGPLPTSDEDNYLYAPRIVYVDRDGQAHLITVDSVTVLPQHERPPKAHFFFSDNTDIKNGAYIGTRVTLALTSGAVVLKEFGKRMTEVKNKVTIYMPPLSMMEMTKLFKTDVITEQEVIFKYGVLGGNPRFFLSNENADENTPFYHQVSAIVEKVFPDEQVRLKTWAKNVVSNGIELYSKSDMLKEASVTDNSLFRELIVSGDLYDKFTEVFVTMFMGLIASNMVDNERKERRRV